MKRTLLIAVALLAGCTSGGASAPTTTATPPTVETTTTMPATTTPPPARSRQVVSPTITSSTQAGGTIVVGADRQPPTLNIFHADGGHAANTMVARAVLPSMVTLTPRFDVRPYVADGLPVVESKDPFSVTWRIRANARWSDGTDITAEDVKATTDYINNAPFNVRDRTGYELITAFDIKDPKTFTVTFSEIYPSYVYLWSVTGAIYQKRALEAATSRGVSVNDFMRATVPFSGGPFTLDSFTRGDNITLVRNESFWGERPARLERIIIRFIEDSQAQVQAIEFTDVDLVYPQSQPEFIRQAEKIEFANYQVSEGMTWEHLDLNVGKVEQLQDVNVRRAIAHAINREEIVEIIVQPLLGVSSTRPLGNVFYVSNAADYYEDAWSRYDYNPAKAREILEAAGWTRGTDGVREKDGERLEFTYSTTSPSRLRLHQQQLIQGYLADVGIRVTPANVESVSEIVPSGNFEIANFVWQADLDPGTMSDVFRADRCPKTVEGCEAEEGHNYINYQNAEVTRLLGDADREPDPAKRAEILNRANELIAADVPVIPLYQTPTLLLYNNRLANVVENVTPEGPMWNVAQWGLRTS